MPLHDVSPADPPTAANALPVPSTAFSHWTFPGWFSLVLEPREPLRPHDRRDAPPAAGVHLVTPTPWTQEQRPPGPRSYRSSLHAQHKARHTACDHKRDLSARMRLDWTWCNPHPGKVPFRGGPTRPGNAGVSCTAGIGMAAGPTAATDGQGPGVPRGGLSPAAPTRKGSNTLHPAAAPGPGSRRYRPRAGDQASRRAGPRSPAPRGRLTPCRWKPSAPPAGCSALAPRPMATAGLRRPCPEPAHRPGAASTDSPSRRSITSALSRGRLATPTPDSDALSNRRAAPSPRTRAPRTSGCERRAQDPDSAIPPGAAPPDPVLEPRAPGDELQ